MTLRIHMSSHDDTLHNSTAKRNLAGGVAGIDVDNYLTNTHIPLHSLTVADFQINTATGTAGSPANLNDGDTSPISLARYNVVNEYCEVLFNHPSLISEYRIFFDSSGADAFKIQYFYNGNWIDNTINILHSASGWTVWTNLTIPVYAEGIRLVGTTVPILTFVREVEIRG